MTSLYGTTNEAITLLLSADASDRATALNFFLEFRDDLPEIVAAVRQHPSTFDVGMLRNLDDLVVDQKKLSVWLADIPDWALDWRIFVAARIWSPYGFFAQTPRGNQLAKGSRNRAALR